jgi:hypothetical protein
MQKIIDKNINDKSTMLAVKLRGLLKKFGLSLAEPHFGSAQSPPFPLTRRRKG